MPGIRFIRVKERWRTDIPTGEGIAKITYLCVGLNHVVRINGMLCEVVDETRLKSPDIVKVVEEKQIEVCGNEFKKLRMLVEELAKHRFMENELTGLTKKILGGFK